MANISLFRRKNITRAKARISPFAKANPAPALQHVNLYLIINVCRMANISLFRRKNITRAKARISPFAKANPAPALQHVNLYLIINVCRMANVKETPFGVNFSSYNAVCDSYTSSVTALSCHLPLKSTPKNLRFFGDPAGEGYKVRYLKGFPCTEGANEGKLSSSKAKMTDEV